MKQWKYYITFVIVFLFVWILMAVGIRQVSGDIIFGADYYTFYTAARMYLFDRINPYSQDVTQAAQLGILGRLATPEEDQLAFAYPFFMLFWVFPFAWLDISLSQPLWMSFNILIALTCLVNTFQNKKILAFLGLTFYPFVYGIILGNFSNLICFILLYFFDQVIFNQPTPARQIFLGFLLFWTIGKPQLTILVLLFALLISLYKKYLTVIISFGVSLVTISSLSILFLPNWFELWIQRIQQYSVYVQAKPANLAQTILSFTNIPEGFILASLSIGVVAVFTGWFLAVYKSQNLIFQEEKFRNLLFLNLIIIFTISLMPRTVSNDQLLLLINLFLGSKFLTDMKHKYHIVVLIWSSYSVISWITFALPIPGNLSSTHTLYPSAISTSWLIFFWLLSKSKMKELSHEPA
ncbi:hypothetical protein [Bellilinea sp.]|uniref:hypothetical protein n=1 Tax=Bellilinea sp. TaxID=2838785 RepID=UPI002ADE0C10|nr:hypothetical protein [Bellilinea sp.]